MAELNAVVQFIVKMPNGRGYQGMAAGSGWFYKHGEDMVIITNAHVVNQAVSTFIRLPANHNENIQVYPVGISTDLDLAVCKMDNAAYEKVKSLLCERYPNITEIPHLEMGDSNAVHAKDFKDLEAPRVITRGYPHGTEYQQFTDGRVSGIKHANEQEYIVTTATIEPGNSGGPCLLNGKVIGINSMKMTNATETNIIIPSNRVKRVLGELLDNQKNMDFIKQLLEQRTRMMSALGLDFAKRQFRQLEKDGIEVDALKINNLWEQHNLGGFKKDADGRISRVSLGDWYQKHVLHVEGSYSLLKQTVEHIHNDNPEEIVNMRKAGFKNFCGENEVENTEAVLGLPLSETPPRLLHMPRLGFRTCNSNAAALKHYGVPSGVIIRDVVPNGVFDRLGVKKYDVITHVNGLPVDNFGDVWFKDLNVSLRIKDIIHRQEFGSTVNISLKSKMGEKTVSFVYSFLKDDEKPNIRVLETLADSSHAKEVMELPNGLVVKTLRLDDVYQMNLVEYMQPHRQNEYRVVVCEIIPGSDAFHNLNFRVGTVLAKIDGEPVRGSWKDVQHQLQMAFKFEDKTFCLESTSGRIMFAEGHKQINTSVKMGVSKEAPFEKED
jgi:S1-C subfamily serine protease